MTSLHDTQPIKPVKQHKQYEVWLIQNIGYYPAMIVSLLVTLLKFLGATTFIIFVVVIVFSMIIILVSGLGALTLNYFSVPFRGTGDFYFGLFAIGAIWVVSVGSIVVGIVAYFINFSKTYRISSKDKHNV